MYWGITQCKNDNVTLLLVVMSTAPVQYTAVALKCICIQKLLLTAGHDNQACFLIFVDSTACSHDHLYPVKPDEKPPTLVAWKCICIRTLLLTVGHDNQACFLIFVDSTACSHDH